MPRSQRASGTPRRGTRPAAPRADRSPASQRATARRHSTPRREVTQHGCSSAGRTCTEFGCSGGSLPPDHGRASPRARRTTRPMTRPRGLDRSSIRAFASIRASGGRTSRRPWCLWFFMERPGAEKATTSPSLGRASGWAQSEPRAADLPPEARIDAKARIEARSRPRGLVVRAARHASSSAARRSIFRLGACNGEAPIDAQLPCVAAARPFGCRLWREFGCSGGSRCCAAPRARRTRHAAARHTHASNIAVLSLAGRFPASDRAVARRHSTPSHQVPQCGRAGAGAPGFACSAQWRISTARTRPVKWYGAAQAVF